MKKKILPVVLSILVVILVISLLCINFSEKKVDSTLETEQNNKISESCVSTDSDISEDNFDEIDLEKMEEREKTETPAPSSEPIVISPEKEPETVTAFEQYNSMSGEAQKAFYDSFEDPDAFFDWYENAKAEYENTHGEIIVGDNATVDFG